VKLPLGRSRKRKRILCFLGGKLKVGVLYLGYSPVCQGRVPVFFRFLPFFSGFSDMYLGAFGEMLWRELTNITMDCGVDAHGAKQ
jgi:hypothetical protein